MRRQKDRAAAVGEAVRAKWTRKRIQEKPEEITHEEVLARYPGQWILMRVTAWDEQYYPERG